MKTPITRDAVCELDRNDPIAAFRDRFLIPDNTIYLDGNSLGPPPRSVTARIEEVLVQEWGRGLVRSWNDAGWIDLPERVAGKIAPLVGAEADEIAVADSTSVNLFKLLAAALRLRPGRRMIVSEVENFGTDLYIAQGLADVLGEGAGFRAVTRRDIVQALDGEVAVLMLTHVDFRSGEMHDLRAVTSAAHDAGAIMLWDLAHSAGAVEVDLDGCGADMAVGCGYKYLNGGPGAPAFAYVARRHHGAFETPLWGWMGHAAPFDFKGTYVPGDGLRRLRVGTPPILSLAALECGVETIGEIGVGRLRGKSTALSELFIALVEQECAGHGFELVSPRDVERRGSQVSLRHRDGYAIMRALIDDGVIGDFRAPDVLRFGFAAAYVRFVDVWAAVAALRRIMKEGRWDRPEYRTRSKVT